MRADVAERKKLMAEVEKLEKEVQIKRNKKKHLDSLKNDLAILRELEQSYKDKLAKID